jgi:hypothetical protein
MNFEEATALKQRNGHLIGQTYRESPIEDIVVAPVGGQAWEDFVKSYVYSDYNGDSAILPYTQLELGVIAFFKRNQIVNGYLFFTDINSLRSELNVL